MASQTSSLIISLIDKVTAPARAVAASVKGIGQAVAAANTASLDRAIAANSASMAALHSRILGTTAAAYGLYKALSLPIKAAADFETSMANIKKVVDFETPAAFKEMGEDIRKLSLRLPMTADQIASIVAAGGQSGIANEDLLTFAEMATKVGVAWDMSADQTGEALAQLKTSLGYTIPQTELLADAINYLSNKTAASAPKLLEFTKRVAPVTKQFGMTAEQASAFGAAMIGSGFDSEVAATSFRNMGNALTRGASATKAQQKAFARLGTSSTQVAKLMQKDAIGTISVILKKISQIPVEQQAALTSDLFGNEARGLAPLFTNGKLLAEVLALVASKTNYAGSAQKEYEEQANTTNNKMVLFRSHVEELSKSIGEGLTPGLNEATEALKPYLLRVADWAKKNPGLVAGLAKTAIAAVGLSGALLAGRYVMLGLKGVVLSLAKPVLGVATLFGRVLVRALMGTLSPMSLVSGALGLLRGALMATGIGALLLAIGAAGKFISDNWSGIGKFFESFGASLEKALGPDGAKLKPIVEALKGLGAWMTGGSWKIEDDTWAKWGDTLGNKVAPAIRSIMKNIEDLIGWINKADEVYSRFFGKATEAKKPAGEGGVPAGELGPDVKTTSGRPAVTLPINDAPRPSFTQRLVENSAYGISTAADPRGTGKALSEAVRKIMTWKPKGVRENEKAAAAKGASYDATEEMLRDRDREEKANERAADKPQIIGVPPTPANENAPAPDLGVDPARLNTPVGPEASLSGLDTLDRRLDQTADKIRKLNEMKISISTGLVGDGLGGLARALRAENNDAGM